MKYVNIIVKRLLSTGPSEHSAKFSDSRRLTNFLGKKNTTYVSSSIRNKKYIITDNLKNYYVITSYNGNKVNVDKKLQIFYDTHFWKNGIAHTMEPLVVPTNEQMQEHKTRNVKVGKLLSLIDIKYGDLVKADGTQEFSELQKLLNAGWI